MEAWMSSAKFVALITYRRDGTPVATPLWFVPGDDHLRVITERDSWKVKRIHNNPTVSVAACDMRGRPRSAPVAGTARILDDSALPEVRRAIARRYRLVAEAIAAWTWLTDKVSRRPPRERVAIEIRFTDSNSDET